MPLSKIGLITHDELCEMLTKDFVYDLRECHGLLALGRGRSLAYDVENVRIALARHARGEVHEPARKPLTREDIRSYRKARTLAK